MDDNLNWFKSNIASRRTSGMHCSLRSSSPHQHPLAGVLTGLAMASSCQCEECAPKPCETLTLALDPLLNVLTQFWLGGLEARECATIDQPNFLSRGSM
jgi:hypothetical protein